MFFWKYVHCASTFIVFVVQYQLIKEIKWLKTSWDLYNLWIHVYHSTFCISSKNLQFLTCSNCSLRHMVFNCLSFLFNIKCILGSKNNHICKNLVILLECSKKFRFDFKLVLPYVRRMFIKIKNSILIFVYTYIFIYILAECIWWFYWYTLLAMQVCWSCC